jgi:hypothetical protein
MYKAEVYRASGYWLVQHHGEEHVLPLDEDPEVCFGPDARAERIEGEVWFARLFMPGYLDCTEPSVHDTEKQAIRSLLEMYGTDDPSMEPEEWEVELNERLQGLG